MLKQILLITMNYPENNPSFFDRFDLPKSTAILSSEGRYNIKVAKGLDNQNGEKERKRKENYFLQLKEDSEVYCFAPVFKNAAEKDKNDYFREIFDYFLDRYKSKNNTIEFTFILHAKDIYLDSKTGISDEEGLSQLQKLNPHPLFRSSKVRLILFTHEFESEIYSELIMPFIEGDLKALDLKNKAYEICEFHLKIWQDMLEKRNGITRDDLERIK